MATGDHGLTAISVAKKCKIIRSNVPVYFGDLESSGDWKFIKWQLMKHHNEEGDEKIKPWIEQSAEAESENYKSMDAKDPIPLQNQGKKKLINHIWKEDEGMS